MSPEIQEYVSKLRTDKVSDQDIKTQLVAAGWPKDQVEAWLVARTDLPSAPMPSGSGGLPAGLGTRSQPLAVSSGASTQGFEYTIMFIALWVAAFCLGGILHSLVSQYLGGSANDGSPFYSAGLLVGLPIFVFLFIRTHKKEQQKPEIMADPSRRRAVQLTMVVAFIFGLGHIVYYLYNILSGSGAGAWGSSSQANPLEQLLHMLVTVFVAGGIFGYYWIQEHRHAV